MSLRRCADRAPAGARATRESHESTVAVARKVAAKYWLYRLRTTALFTAQTYRDAYLHTRSEYHCRRTLVRLDLPWDCWHCRHRLMPIRMILQLYSARA